MKGLRILLPVPLVAAIAFSLYGYTTTFEAMEPSTRLQWRIIYGSICLVCALALAILLTASVLADNRKRPSL